MSPSLDISIIFSFNAHEFLVDMWIIDIDGSFVFSQLTYPNKIEISSGKIKFK